MKDAKHIVIEGMDATGKSSVAVALKERLSDGRYKGCDLFKSPSFDGPIGGLIREIFNGFHKVHPLAMMHLFVADEIDQEAFVARQLAIGHHVVRDRHTGISGAVYQTEKHPARVALATFPVGMFKRVDLVVLLDCDPKVALERRIADERINRNTGKLYQNEDLSRLERLRDCYLAQQHLHADLVERWLVIDVTEGVVPADIARAVSVELDV